MNINKLGQFKVNGAIDTQFQTTLAVERVLIASGEKVKGITSFLVGLEMIGAFLTIFLGLFLIGAIVSIHVLLFIVRVFKTLSYTKRTYTPNNTSSSTKSTSFTDVSEEDEEKIDNFV